MKLAQRLAALIAVPLLAPALMASTVGSASATVSGALHHDLNGDTYNDLVMFGTDPTLFEFYGNGVGGLLGPAYHQVGTAHTWDVFDIFMVTSDFNGDGTADLIGRGRADGYLYLYKGYGNGSFAPYEVAGTGWKGFDKIVAPGDFSGDGKSDLIARKLDGTMWLYRGNGAGRFINPGLQIGTGWKGFDKIVAPGDFNGDGKSDLIARKLDGTMWLYRGNGADGFINPGLQIATGWAVFDAIVAHGDFNGDGKADLIGRVKGGDTANPGWCMPTGAPAACGLWLETGDGLGGFYGNIPLLGPDGTQQHLYGTAW